jgi:LysR family transcriptional regulator for bpeEF and oprC
MDSLRTLRLFVSVADTGSYTEAAERLKIPRATASNAILQLERSLGVKLLARTTRRVRLTAEGAQFLEHGRSLIEQWDDAQNMFAAHALQPEGTIHLDLPERMANITVIPALPELLARYPGLRVVVSGNARFVDLIAEGVDCVVRVGELDNSGLTARRVGRLHIVNCATPDYLARHPPLRDLADLTQHCAIGFRSGRGAHDTEWDYLDAAGDAGSIRMQSRVTVSNTESYIACALAGLGLIQTPRIAVAAHLASGALREVLPSFSPAPLPVSVIYLQRKLVSARVRVFVDWLAALLERELREPAG